MLRLIGECRPRYAIFENVTALLPGDNGKWFARFLYDLAAVGLDAEWHCIPASAVGAMHQRDRVWIIAYTKKDRDQEFSKPHCGEHQTREKRAVLADKLSGLLGWARHARQQPKSKSGICRMVNGVSDEMDRLGALGNSVYPVIPEIIGRAIMEIENQSKVKR